jgi:metallo-beta-lactamase family protein
VRFARTVEESRALNGLDGPLIVVSASGMCTAGRILHHLRARGPDPRNLVLLVGFQAAGTRGRALAEGARSLRMHGRDFPFRAEVLQVHGLSGHADAEELVAWVAAAPERPRTVFVNHGEPEASAALAERVRALGCEVRVPAPGEGWEL